MSPPGSAAIVGQFEDAWLGPASFIGAMLLTALVGLGLSVLLRVRNRSGRQRKPMERAARTHDR